MEKIVQDGDKMRGLVTKINGMINIIKVFTILIVGFLARITINL